jgi:2-keto-3-deoxy-L-rhamnonate aldolase RhmA
MTDPAQDYATRAATFRRLADELKNANERAALLAIAEQYEAVAARLRGEGDEEAEGDN